MRRLEKFLLKGTAYTVGIMLVFFLLSLAFELEVYLGFVNYLTCILIGFAINAANLVFSIPKLQIWFKVPIHYAALIALYIPFLYISIPDFMQRESSIFVAIMIYTIFYAVLVAIIYGIKKLVSKIDDKIEAK